VSPKKAAGRKRGTRRHQTISACLIVLNEEEALPEALASVEFCDEIVVVDSGSNDATVEIARKTSATVIESPWHGFGAQRNLAIDRARSDWILELDADERVTPELRYSLETFLVSPEGAEFDIAAMPIRQIFLGRALRGSARYPDYRHRVFRRGAYRHDESRTVHEGISPHGPVWILGGDLRHELAASARDAVRDSARYARLEAEQISAPRGLRAVITGIVLRPPVKFLAQMFVFGGWRDGWRGWMKSGLDCSSDAIVWTRYLRSGRKPVIARSGHFGSEQRREGSVRLVGLTSKDASATAIAWLDEAKTNGADVSLVGTGVLGVGPVRVRSIRRITPLRALRALDSEWQLRPYDALVVFGAGSKAIARTLPSRLRGFAGLINPELSYPRALTERLRRERDEGGESR
jgi:Glycosyl transferase family 2